jgi:phosphatidylserine/phosphatidylglycerophosphate/cardiolipin synthase-like enzyme
VSIPPGYPHNLSDLTSLDQFVSGGNLPASDPNFRSLYSPVDQVHEALVFIIGSATRSLVVAMYGFDDQELADIIHTKLSDPLVYVQLTLDSSQAGGVHERAILAQEQYPNSSISIGRSEKGAIMHLKSGVIDSAVVFQGSTNWSAGGEAAQDNDLTVQIDTGEAARLTTRNAAIHTNQLQVAANQQGSPS